MLQNIRDNSGKWFVKVIFGLIVASFLVFGIGDMIRGIIMYRPIVKIGSHTIATDEFSHRVSQEFSRIQSLTKGKFTPSQLKDMGVVDNFLEKMIEESLIDQEYERLGLVASNALIKNNVQRMEQFQTNGQFDHSRYENMLKEYGLSERMLVEDARKNFIKQQYFGPLVTGPIFSTYYKDLLLQASEQKRTFSVVRINASNLRVDKKPVEKDLIAYYDANKNNFKKPESRMIAVMEIDVDALAKSQDVSDADIKAAYDDRIAEFTTPERRDVQVAIFPTEDAAKSVLASVQKGMNLESASKKHEESQFQNVGLVEKNSLRENIRDVVFGLKSGSYSEVIHSNFGFQIYHVGKIEPEVQKSFTDVRESLHKELKRERYADEYDILKNRIDDELAGGATLHDVAKQYKLSVSHHDNVEKNGKNLKEKGVLKNESKSILDLAFGLDPQNASPVTDIKDGVAVVVYVDRVNPEHIPEFENVRADVADQYMQVERLKKALAMGQKIAMESKSVGDLAKKASQHGVPMKTNISLSRSDLPQNAFVKKTMSGDVFNRGFLLTPGKTAVGRYKDGFMVLLLERVQPFSKDAIDKKKRKTIEDNIKLLGERDVADGLVNSFRKHHKVKVNEDNFNYFLKTIENR